MISFNELGYYGRFGNQMFQYAALRGVAAKHGYYFCIPKSNVEFNFERYAYSPCIPEQAAIIGGDGEGHLLSLAFELSAATHQRPVELLRRNFVNEVKEADDFKSLIIHYATDMEEKINMSLLEACPAGVSLYGWFQDDRYFKHIEDELRQDFTFKAPIRAWCADKLRDTVQTKCFSIHVRRGDYLELNEYITSMRQRTSRNFVWGYGDIYAPGIKTDLFPVLSPTYYEKAVQEFDPSWVGLVFSDDPQWCMQQELFQNDRFIVLDIPDTVHSMCLMSMCDGHIIANSSFSWWAAWLGGGKRVRPGDICHA